MNSQVPDSGSTATAMFTGIKTNHRVVGFDSSAEYMNVNHYHTAKRLDSILKWAQDSGMSTGFVTDTR